MEVIQKYLSSLWQYLIDNNVWMSIGKGTFRIIAIIILMRIAIGLVKKVVDRIFHRKQKGPFHITKRREETLNKLIQNVATYIIYFTAFVMILDTLTIQIGPLLAGAGIAGLAIGFGAQNLVKDIISGFFIVFEDQFGVGDYVSFAGIEGTVEEIGLRTTKVKSWTGEQQIIPNGNIAQVTNYSIHNGLAIVDINIPYENDITVAEKIIEDVLSGLADKYEQIVSTPVIHGVQNLETSHVVLRVIAETLPVYQWSGARVIRKEVKERLYKEGINIPAPRLVLYTQNEQPTAYEIDRRK